MIPKIIHLCWLSGDPYPAKIAKCLDTWKKYLPKEMRTKSDAYQGPKYFSYQGKTLWKIRVEREKD